MLTPAQLEERRGWVGASDIAAIMCGCNYRKPRDVWLEKVYGLEPENPSKEFDAKMWGHILEPSTLRAFEIARKVEVQTTDLVRFVEGTRIRCTLDGWIKENGMIVPVEGKTTGTKNSFGVDPAVWGESGTDHFPDKYIIQLHAQMMATGSTYGYLSAILVTPQGMEYRWYRCERVEVICDAILEAVEWFWKHVEDGIEPEGESPSKETYKRLIRQPESRVRIPVQCVEPVIRWKQMVAKEREAKAEKEAARDEVTALLGNAEGGMLELHADYLVPLADALGVAPEDAGAYCKLTYYADKRGSRTLRLQKADDDFMLAACDAPLIDLKKLNLIQE